MKTLHTVRRALLSATAITAMILPLWAGAAVLDAPTPKVQAALEDYDLNDTKDQQELYERLKNRSREICGTTNLHVTGSVQRSAGNEACYEGTLTAAVKRVNNPALTQLHQQ